jgi:hypothetical protein
MSNQSQCLEFSEKMAPKCLTFSIFTYEKRKLRMTLSKTRAGMKNEWSYKLRSPYTFEDQCYLNIGYKTLWR